MPSAVIVPLTQGKFALIDYEDAARVCQYKWYACFQRGRWYALRMTSRKGKRKPLGLHQFILRSKAGEEIDHKHGNGLDNRKSQLRFVTRTQNNANQRKQRRRTSSQFKGVTWDKRTEQWMGQLQHLGKRFFLGRFDREIDAARAYDIAARHQFGQFARPNFSA